MSVNEQCVIHQLTTQKGPHDDPALSDLVGPLKAKSSGWLLVSVHDWAGVSSAPKLSEWVMVMLT